MRVSSLPRGRFALLFAIMLVAASGNTAMQSLMPSIGRELGVTDLWVAVAFSLSAVGWVLTALPWARLSDRKSDVEGKSGSVRVDFGGGRIIKHTNTNKS